MPQKTSLFSQYTLDYPNRDPDKISVYAVGWISIALLGLCVMFADIPAGVLLIVFFGLILTSIMLWKNPDVFDIKRKQNIPWMIAAYSLLYLSTVTFAYFHWQDGQQRSLSACIISAVLISLLLFYILYRWQRKVSTEDALKHLQKEQNQSFSSLQEKIEKTTEDSLKQIQEKQEQFEKTTGNSLEQLHAKTEQSVSSLQVLQEQFAKSAEELKQKIHPDSKFAELDLWATVPDCVSRILEILFEDGFLTRKQIEKISRNTIRINLQNRLRESHAEVRHASNANFYKTIDIATEAVKEFPELQIATLLAELNLIASPGNALKRAKKSPVQRTSEDF